MFKLCLPLIAILMLGGAISATTLEWPAGLVALSAGKSVQSLPVATVEEEPAEAVLETSSSAAAAAAANDEEEELVEASNAEIAEARVISPLPVSVPLPLIVAARLGLRTVLTIQEPAVAKVGELVQHVPTAVSHQSQTIVHDHKRLVTPIVAPALRTTQLVRQQPILWTTVADPRVLLLKN